MFMTDQEIISIFSKSANATQVSALQWRLSPAGSGAADGCAGREAGGQPADEEARSVESRAVAPVESAMKEEPLTSYERVKLLIDVAINRRPYHGELSAAAAIIALDQMGLIDRVARRRQVSEASGRRNEPAQAPQPAPHDHE